MLYYKLLYTKLLYCFALDYNSISIVEKKVAIIIDIRKYKKKIIIIMKLNDTHARNDDE